MFNQFFNNPNYTTTPAEEDYKWERDNEIQALNEEIQDLEAEIKDLEEENAWLRYTLDRFGLIGKADDEFKKLVGVN